MAAPEEFNLIYLKLECSNNTKFKIIEKLYDIHNSYTVGYNTSTFWILCHVAYVYKIRNKTYICGWQPI